MIFRSFSNGVFNLAFVIKVNINYCSVGFETFMISLLMTLIRDYKKREYF